jgi:hypothetical protein
MDELRYARHFGKPIIVLLIEDVKAFDLQMDDYPTVDFRADREAALALLLKRVAALNTREGKAAQLQEVLRRARNGLRRLSQPERLVAEEAIRDTETRLRDLLARGAEGSLYRSGPVPGQAQCRGEGGFRGWGGRTSVW